MKTTPLINTLLVIIGMAFSLRAQTSSVLVKSGDTINGISSNSATLRSFGNLSMNNGGGIAFQGYATETNRIITPVTVTNIGYTTNFVPWTNFVFSTNIVSSTNAVVTRVITNVITVSTNYVINGLTNSFTNTYPQYAYQTNYVVTNCPVITSVPVLTNRPVLTLTNFVITTNRTTATTTNYYGIWNSDSNGVLNLTFRSGLPSPNPSITRFTDPVLNNNGATAFMGYSYTTNGFLTNMVISTNVSTGVVLTNTVTNPIVVQTNSTIYLALRGSASNNLLSVASVGSPAPGTSDNFTAFSNLALPDVGGVIFVGMAGTNQGVWVQNPDASVRLVAIRGQSMTVGNTNKILNSFSLMNGPYPGVTRSYSDTTGVIIYQAYFTDGTSAAIRVDR